jgi:LmbE family N-acetylglucosaminyl deacetylase
MSTTAREHPLKILVIVAHPHDFTHVAGTCGQHVDRGDSVTVVTVTGGAHLHNEPLERELRKPKDQQDPAIVNEATAAYSQRKRHELDDACAVFGITDVRVLPFPDVFLEPSAELDRALVEIILEVRPDVLLTHAPFAAPQGGHYNVGSSDHRTTGIAVERACALAATPDAQSRHIPHRIAKTFYQGVEWGYHAWDLIVDITDQVHKRVKAEGMFTTQGHFDTYAIKTIQVQSGYAGWYGRFPYGEVFIAAHPTLSDHLPVTGVELSHAERPTMDDMRALATRLEDLL